MAMNLRLESEAEEALRTEAARSGRSQQEIVREAVSRHLALVPEPQPATNDRDALVATGLISPARRPYRKVVPSVSLPSGQSSLELLDRDDRL